MAMLLTDRPGYVVSGSVHVALLVATLLSFSHAREFDANVESVPVETLSDEQFSKIMKGEKQAKQVQPAQKADKVADTSEVKPDPPIAEAKKDVPTPPPPLKRIADPGEAQQPQDVPTPPQRVAALPPPEPPKPVAKVEPPKPQPPVPTPPEKPVIKEEADAEVPKPVRRPDPPKPKPVTPTPPEPPKVEARKPEFKPDQLAKLLEQAKQKDAQKPVPQRPKSGDESEPTHRFDTADISKLLSHEAAQRRASSGAHLQQVASLGAPNASAAQMSPSLWDQLDGLLQDQYKQCWSYIGAQNLKYVPEIKVQYAQDGSLVGMPQLVNPPSDPALQNLAESAKRAVLRCNPLHIPAVFQPFYEQWRGRIVRFDPQELS